MTYVTDLDSGRQIRIDDQDWEFLAALGAGDVSTGIRVATTLARTMDSQHNLIKRAEVERTKSDGGDSLMFATQVKDAFAMLTPDQQSQVLVEEYRTGIFLGLTFHDLNSKKRCNVYLDPITHAPQLAYGMFTEFYVNSGHPTPKADTIAFTKRDPEVIANYMHRYFTDSIS